MSAVTDSIIAAFDALQETYSLTEYADSCAVGVWTDDPADPGVTAVVFQGKLFSLVIPDSYLQLDGPTLSDIINAVIINAYIEWDSDRGRILREEHEARKQR